VRASIEEVEFTSMLLLKIEVFKLCHMQTLSLDMVSNLFDCDIPPDILSALT
jgi:hypothetical protein